MHKIQAKEQNCFPFLTQLLLFRPLTLCGITVFTLLIVNRSWSHYGLFLPITVFNGYVFLLVLRNVAKVSWPLWKIFYLILQLGYTVNTNICLCAHRTVSDSHKIQIQFDFHLKSPHSDSFTDRFRMFQLQFQCFCFKI